MSNEEDEKCDKPAKAPVISRFVAYLVDCLIVMLVASFISAPFLDSGKVSSISNDSIQLMQRYQNKEITEKEYLADLTNMQYKMSRSMIIYNIFSILISVLYFVVLPLYKNGQTLGKKMMKLRIVSSDSELTSNQLVLRAFIVNGVLFSILSVLLVMFVPRSLFFSLNEEFSMIRFLIMLVSTFMILFSKTGVSIHDAIAHTKVISIKE